KELAELSRIRQRKYRCVAVALLGYFKCKPILLNPSYKSMQDDSLHASADGQKFEAKRETFRTRYSSKYFGTSKGVSAVSLN
ncbi:Tn3 family transposase, partial [Acinetobacter johnsonii]|uniref:Tn3 family transposase n=2 Tax=Acinetobacter TaxID=469 RepID=UPI00398CD2B5